MNRAFKVHKLEPSVMLVCETRGGESGGDAGLATPKIRQTAESGKDFFFIK